MRFPLHEFLAMSGVWLITKSTSQIFLRNVIQIRSLSLYIKFGVGEDQNNISVNCFPFHFLVRSCNLHLKADENYESSIRRHAVMILRDLVFTTSVVIWVVTPCSVAESYQHSFETTSCHNPEDRTLQY
jgi:hypothetical protein